MVKCKSSLDSQSVTLRAFDGSSEKASEGYKLFNDDNLRNVVFNRMRQQFAVSGACPPNAKVKLCLACDRIATNADRKGLRQHFAEKGWELWDEPWLRQRLLRMSDLGYEKQVSGVVDNLLLREKVG